MADEPFSIKKLFGGFLNPVTWSKAVVIGAMLAILIIGGFTIYRAYFMKTGSNISKPTHTPTNIMLPGSGDIGTLDQSQDVKSEQKTEVAKRPWWWPIPFIQATAGVRNKEGGTTSFEPDYRLDAGVRLDLQ